MKRLWKAAIAATGVAMLAGPVLAVSPAGATPPTGYGFDGTSHSIVGGGSDTTYHTQVDLNSVYNVSQKNGCTLNTAVGPDLGKCIVLGSAETNTLVNYGHDNLSELDDVGSSAGISALNGTATANYSGALHTMPAGEADIGPSAGLLPDFARSSRGPKTSGGASASGNELNADTFWGFAQDGLELMVFNARGAQVQAAGGSAITANEVYHIFNCDFTTWAQVPSLHITAGSANDGPIVAWGMNPSAGTYATFNTYLQNNGGAPAGWAANGQACVKPVIASPLTYSIENDIKPIVNSIGAFSTANNSVNNPKNWIWWGSFGAFSAYPNTSKTTAPRHDGHGDRGADQRCAAEHQRHPRRYVPDGADAVPRDPQARRRLPAVARRDVQLHVQPGPRDQRRRERPERARSDVR